MDACEESVLKLTLVKLPEIRMEKCLFDTHEIELPEVLLEDYRVFSEVLNQQTWATCLTDGCCSGLLKLLPQFPENDLIEKQATLEMLFSGKNFKFGNPLKQFHRKLKDGRYLPDIVRYSFLCRKAQQQDYQFQQEIYYENLLCEILLNRQTILEELYQTPPEATVKFDHIYWSQNLSKQRNQNLNHRVNQKCHQLIREVNQECGQADTSSDEEETSFSGCNAVFMLPSRSQNQNQKLTNWVQNVNPDSPEFERTSVLETFAPKLMTPMTSSVALPVLKKWQHSSGKHQLLNVTGEDYQELMRKHKKRKTEYPNHPELNTNGITLDEIISRTQISKKVKSSLAVNSKKKLKKTEANKKVILKCSEMEMPSVVAVGNTPSLSQTLTKPNAECASLIDKFDVSDLLSIKKEDTDEEIDVQSCSNNQISGSRPHFGRYANFFSLLKELIHEDSEDKLVTSKLEEKVREWQESDSVAELNPWFKDQTNWVDLVSSALKFLSGDVLGLSLENFVPVLDYKERAQQWRWIGQGRDTDEELASLYAYWAKHRETDQLDSGFDKMASVPPPRMWTEFLVRPSTDEERLQFQIQEKERFSNPHKAYTYRMHAYESVVGPVKGVYAKENAIIKAREHALLIKDRPSYVTILTLVHDGAARLPNGEGTRNDICELLKDSQFLSSGITESQINTVVSGALDRLHYEKDPCVKYDGTRKLWIYRHRNRTEEEFEKIHQAQAAAAKAKKMALPKKSKFIKPSVTKKVKDTTSIASQKPFETSVLEPCALESLSAANAVPQVTVPCSLSSINQSIPLTSAVLSTDITTLPSPSCNQISFGSQKGISLGSSIAFPSVHSLMSETIASESDVFSTVLSSAPTKSITTDVKHQISSVTKSFTISLVQHQKPIAVTALHSNIQTPLMSVSKPVAFGLIQSHLAGSNAPSCTTLSSTSSIPLASALSCSDNLWPQSKAVVFPQSSFQTEGSKTKIVALQQLPKSLNLPSLPTTHLQQQVKTLKHQQQQQSPDTANTISAGYSLAVLQTSSHLCAATTSTSSRPFVTGPFQLHQQNHSNVILPVGLTSVSGKSGISFLCGEKSSFTAPSSGIEVKDPLISVNKGLFSPSDTVSVTSSNLSTTSAVMKSDISFTLMTASSPVITQQLAAAQLLKPLGGKPKPIFISGKPATVLTSGKPFSISGKQMLISRGETSTLCVTSGMNVFDQPGVALATAPKSAVSSSFVSQILQSGTLFSQQGGLFRGGLVRVSNTGQVIFSSQHSIGAQSQEQVSGNGQVIFSGQHSVRAGAQNQVRVGNSSSGQMKLMSIPTSAIGPATRIIVPDQSGLIVASPLPSQSISGSMQNAKSEQNVQIIKSLITPASLSINKQHQTAILMTNPTTPSLSITMEQDERRDSALVNSNARPKPGPVFARIITPPANIQLTGMHSGQMLTPNQLTSMQGLVQVSGSQLSLDANQIQQLVAAQQRNKESLNELNATATTEADSR